MVRTIFDQPDAASVRDQLGRVVEAIEARFPDAATHLDDARSDLLAFTGFPHAIGGDSATVDMDVMHVTRVWD
jgi:putative transposase